MGTQILLGKCKCGWLLKLKQNQDGAWSYCPRRSMFNFWKHDGQTRHAWFPKGVK